MSCAETIDVTEVLARLYKAENILLLCHKNPDGDTIGSSAALYHALQASGQDRRRAVRRPHPPALRLYADRPVRRLVRAGVRRGRRRRGHPALRRRGARVLRAHRSVHRPPSLEHGYADAILLDGSAAATAELMYDVLTAMAPRSTRSWPSACTRRRHRHGCFKFANTTARTHAVAAKLIEAGADVARLNIILFENKSRSRLAVEQLALENLEYHFDGRCALTHLTKEEIAATGAEPTTSRASRASPAPSRAWKWASRCASSPRAATRSACAPCWARTRRPSPRISAAAATSRPPAANCSEAWRTRNPPFSPRWKKNYAGNPDRRQARRVHVV